MPQNSPSPPRNRARHGDRTDRPSTGRNYDDRHDKSYDRRKHEDDTRGRREDGRRSRRDNYREYGERERERDRERYDSGRDRDRRGYGSSAGPSARRSASPRSRPSRPHSERPRSQSRSRSPSPINKAKPNFAPSGLLAAETNTVKAANGDSTVLKYNEPPEARKPVLNWRLYVFKGSEQVGECYCHITVLQHRRLILS